MTDRTSNPNRTPAGLYIHVPFCKTKCPYCDFYSTTDLESVSRWIDALSREMDLYRDLFSSFDSVYFGGGTPSLLDEPAVRRLMATVLDHWQLDPGTEITVEANPDDITEEKLLLYRSLGIGRLSVGVQSFNDRELLFLKRRHDSRGARRALDLVLSSGFDNFGVDLMYGLKGQTRSSWDNSLAEALAFEPAHLSCYQLTVEDRTPFGKLRAEGILKPLGDEAGRRFFLATSHFLQDRGFIHYEISNFAKAKGRMSRHNRKYWAHTPYLGLGPAAHSFLDGKRWWNRRSVKEYCAHLDQGTRPVEGSETLTPQQLRLERLYFGFRTRDGLSVSDLDCDGPTGRLALLEKEGLVRIEGERVVPTIEGFLVADRLPLMFAD